MSVPTRTTPVLGMLLAGLVACEDANPSQDTTSAPNYTLTQDQFAAEFRDLTCQNLQRCCTALNLGFDTVQCSSAFADAGQASDSSVFDPNQGAKCLADLQERQGCNTRSNPASCSLAYAGSLAVGQPCSKDLDCVATNGEAASCDQLTQSCMLWLRGHPYETCQRSCEQRSNGAISCVWGAASNPAADDATIVNCFANDGLMCGDSGQCVALGKTGAACVSDDTCERSLYCAVNSSTNAGTCQARPSVGQSCSDYQLPCVRGAFCNAGTCVARKANGQSCLLSAECLGICDCGSNGDCSANGQCVDPSALTNAWTLALIASSYCRAPE